MCFTLFWSWQSDTRANCNRTLIRRAIDAAVSNVAQNDPLICDYEVHEGVVNESGTPMITDVILSRIRECNVFVGDLTLVGQIGENKLTPNPNVLLEMGYAASQIGCRCVSS